MKKYGRTRIINRVEREIAELERIAEYLVGNLENVRMQQTALHTRIPNDANFHEVVSLGWTQVAIARHFGLSQPGVCRWMKDIKNE